MLNQTVTFMSRDLDEIFMQEAVAEAHDARDAGEVPVGAVVVRENRVIGRGRNRTREENVATSHAEMEAIADATVTVADWRLTGCTLYVTLEPCPMCAFAAILARVDRVVFGAADPKFGGCGSVMNVLEGRFNHRPQLDRGILGDECATLIREFFRRRRKEEKAGGAIVD